MKEELGPEPIGVLPTAPPGEEIPMVEEYQPQYPVVQTLAAGPEGKTLLCADPYREGVQVVQKLINERNSRQIPDLVEHGFARLQGLVHPASAPVRDFGWEGSQAFLVREWIQGVPLSQALNQLRLEEILGIFRQLLQVLDYLYTQNIFHLHLKPENLFVVSGGAEGPWLKLTDFGLSEVLHRPYSGRKGWVGTPPYTAPDYATDPRPDARADLYGVGVLCYWALSRQLPYSGPDARSIIEAQKKSEPKPLEKIAQVPAKLSQWVQSMIQPSAQDRPKDPRQAYREFLSLTSSMTLKGPSFPPLLFSDPDQIFRRKTAIKTFRRMMQLGGRWAVQGPPGMGKSFFSRWVQRFFWSNGKSALLYDGRKISQLTGEVPPDSGDLQFVLIDQADQGPVPAWLEARSYPHVILFGEKLSWAKQDSAWKFVDLEKLDEVFLKEIEAETFGDLPDSTRQTLRKFHRGNPGEMVRQARALAQQGAILESMGKWKIREEGLQRALPVGGGESFDPILNSLDPPMRPVLQMLCLVQVPLAVETIADWCDRDAEALHPFLLEWVRQEWLVRRVWWGQEFFQSQMPSPQGAPEGIGDDEIQSWVLGLEHLGWYPQAKELLERAYPPDKLQRNSDLVLIRSRLAGWVGDLQIVFQNITSTFVKDLTTEQQGSAFEILGRALMAEGKTEQAESSYKKAFAQHRAGQDLAGQVQVLTDLGRWYGEQGDPSRAMKYFEQALVISAKLPEGATLPGQVYFEIARFYQNGTDYSRAGENYLKSIEPFIRNRDYHWLAQAYRHYSELLLRQGELQQAENYAREALSIAVFKEDGATLAATSFILSQVEEHHENPAGVLQRLGEVIFLLETHSLNPLYGEALVRRANFYEQNRQLEKALKEAEKILALGHKNQNEYLKAQGHRIRGKVARRDLKRLEEAFNEFQIAQGIFERGEYAQFAWECAFELGEIERNRGNPQKARTQYETALNRLNHYVNSLPPPAQEQYLKDGKREQIEMALKWLR